MTSAYEATTEREQQQKATTPRASTKAHFDNRELDNPDNPITDMENSSLSREANLATDSSSEQLATEVNVLPSESFQEDLSALDENACKEEDKNEKGVDVSRMNRSKRNEESRINEKHKDNSVLNLSANNNVAPENAFTCHAKEDEHAKDDKIEDQERGSKDQDQRNRSIVEIGVQERHMICDSNIRDKSRDFTAGDIRACYEKVAELGLDMKDEMQNEGTEREIIIGRQDSDSFYDAVRSGDVKRVSALIASGCVQNLDEPDWNVSGDPPLLMAATNHCLPVLR